MAIIPNQQTLNMMQGQAKPAAGSSGMSPEMQAALVSGAFGIGGGLLAGYGQSKQNDQNNQAASEQAELNRQLQLYLAQMDQRQRQAEQGMAAQQATPNRQDWRQRQAILADVLPGLRNVNIGAPQDLNRFMPQVNGGLRLPEGGLSPEALAFFSPGARAAAESDLDRAGAQASGGQMATPNYAAAGYGQAGMPAQQQVTDYSAKLREAQQQAQLQGMNNAAQRLTQTRTQQQRQPQSQGPGMGAKIGQAALAAGLAYAGSKWGGGQPAAGGQQQSPWLNMALQAAGGYFGR